MSSFQEPYSSQRIVYVDSFTTFPIPGLDVTYSTFRKSDVKRVPIVRIYGPTIKGEKLCSYIHGIFPYLYIDSKKIDEDEDLEKLSGELDSGINNSLGMEGDRVTQHVFKMIRVSGTSFYGYKGEGETFIKIYFYSPIALNKAAYLLINGKIRDDRIQIYESHIPFILQFFIDFKLYGMNFINFSGGFRYVENDAKRSRTQLEAHFLATQIIISKSTQGCNPGIEAIWEDERERRKMNGIEKWSDIEIPLSPERPSFDYIFDKERGFLDALHEKFRDVMLLQPLQNESFTPDLFPFKNPSTPSSTIFYALPPNPAPHYESFNFSALENEEDAELVDMINVMESESELKNHAHLRHLNNMNDLINDEDMNEENNDDEESFYWTQDDFLSTSVLDFLDKAEKNTGSIPQVDGNFSSSDDDDSESSSLKFSSKSGNKKISKNKTERTISSSDSVVSSFKCGSSNSNVNLPSVILSTKESSESEIDDIFCRVKESKNLRSSLKKTGSSLSPLKKYIGVEPPSPPLISSDSDSTQFSEEDENNASNNKVKKDVGIMSFYEYAHEISDESGEENENDEEMPSQNDIQSFYEYSSEDENEDAILGNLSFQNVAMTQVESEENSSCDEKIEIITKNVPKKSDDDEKIPSLFSSELTPLKMTLNYHQVETSAPIHFPIYKSKRKIAIDGILSTLSDLTKIQSLPDSDGEEIEVKKGKYKFRAHLNSDESDESSDSSSSESSSDEEPSQQKVLTNIQKSDKNLRNELETTPVRSGVKRKRKLEDYLSLNESEIDGVSFSVTPEESTNLNSSNFQDVKALHDCQFLTMMSMEVLTSCRGSLLPDPEIDKIHGIFYSISHDGVSSSTVEEEGFGAFIVESGTYASLGLSKASYFKSELDMLIAFIEFVQKLDPDILIGYEINKFSWGYLIDRGIKLGLGMMSELSRVVPKYRYKNLRYSTWNESISGRVVLNLWKLLRHEITTTSYDFENAVFLILHEKTPLFSYDVLYSFWNNLAKKGRVVNYYKTRVEYQIKIIEKLDLINRTSELARLFGIQFFEVLSRGSQFRVESMMLRLAKPLDFIPPSPNHVQRDSQKRPEFIPLILQPESNFYTDPVAVLDFQSLYPSLMMAYNYCYSTCIGRVSLIGSSGDFELGCLSNRITDEDFARLLHNDLIHVSPAGVAFVKSCVKKGVLGDMLNEILNTRQMVKRAMKKWKDNETLGRVLDSRQLGLKLIANVTYGYTAASFSGRMPCIEISDSIVSKGVETLQRAINLISEYHSQYGGEVVYGDTDSVFIHFKGKSRSAAFSASESLVTKINESNPKPIKIKLEKVYSGLLLQSKKRYVGMAYESPLDSEAKFEGKGIETVRRDGCALISTLLRNSLKILFMGHEEDRVRNYVQDQIQRVFLGRVSLSRFVFAKQYRGRLGYRPNSVVPALQIARRRVERDRRGEPLSKSRVPYVIVYGEPNSQLIDLVREVDEFIGDRRLRLNYHYYIEKGVLPALNRCFSLAGMDVFKWYSEVPRKYLKSYVETGGVAKKKGRIDQYFKSESCIKCLGRSELGFCSDCFKTIEELKDYLLSEQKSIVEKHRITGEVCRDCSEVEDLLCVNLTCTVKSQLLRYEKDVEEKLPKIEDLISKLSLALF